MATRPRVTWFFKDNNTGYGWSVTLWPTTQNGTLGGALGLAKTLALKMGNTFAPGVAISEIRASFDDTFRDSAVAPGPVAGTVANDGQLVFNASLVNRIPSHPNLCQLCRLECGINYRGSLFWSGPPSDYLSEVASGYTVDPVTDAAMSKLMTAISNGDWSLEVLPKGADGPAATAIQNVVFTGTVPTVTSTAHGLRPGTPVRIIGAKMNGGRFSCSNLPVAIVDVNTFTIPGYKRTNHGAYIGGGTVQDVTRVIQVITDATAGGVTTHKRGRFFGQRRGRLSALAQ